MSFLKKLVPGRRDRDPDDGFDVWKTSLTSIDRDRITRAADELALTLELAATETDRLFR